MKWNGKIRKPGPQVAANVVVIAADGKTRYRADVYIGVHICFIKTIDPVTRRELITHVEPTGNKHGDYRELPKPTVPNMPMIPGLVAGEGTGPNTLP